MFVRGVMISCIRRAIVTSNSFLGNAGKRPLSHRPELKLAKVGWRATFQFRRNESDSGLLPHQAGRPALATVEPDENPERGLSGAHPQRKYGRAAVAITAEKREHAAQAHSL